MLISTKKIKLRIKYVNTLENIDNDNDNVNDKVFFSQTVLHKIHNINIMFALTKTSTSGFSPMRVINRIKKNSFIKY